MTDDRLIVALDFHTMSGVKNLVNELGDSVNFYKVGMELFYSVGAGVVEWLKERDKKIFLDLKLHVFAYVARRGYFERPRGGRLHDDENCGGSSSQRG